MRRICGFALLAASILFSSALLFAQNTEDKTIQVAEKMIALLNKGDFEGAHAMFDDAGAKAVSVAQLEGLKTITQSLGAFEAITTRTISGESANKIATLTLKFKNGTMKIIAAANEAGKLSRFFIADVAKNAAPSAPDEKEISFTSGQDAFYGTLLIPANAHGKIPAVLLIAGSGPTDRDGNSRLMPGSIDTLKHFARILADEGIASLRYDKYGTGKTGLASYSAKVSDITFDAFVDTAMAAYRYLGSRPEIDGTRLAILGHSEGGLIALVAADRLKADHPPFALLLAASTAKPYMKIIREQITGQYAIAVKAGQFTKQQADEGMAELDRIIAQVTKEATAPEKMSPQFAPLFDRSNLKFLQNADKYDPAKIASTLPPAINVAMLCGQKDQQVSCDDSKLLTDSFKQGGNVRTQFNEIVDMNHVFKEVPGVPNPQVDYTDPNKPFSPEADRIIKEFVKTKLKQ